VREDLQRQLAVSEGQLGLMQEHLAEAQQEVEGLRQRVSLEQGRTAGTGWIHTEGEDGAVACGFWV